MEGGPFSEYMTQGPWNLQDVLESAAAGGGGGAAAEGLATAGAGRGRMQTQGLGQRSPEVVHHFNGQFYFNCYFSILFQSICSPKIFGSSLVLHLLNTMFIVYV